MLIKSQEIKLICILAYFTTQVCETSVSEIWLVCHLVIGVKQIMMCNSTCPLLDAHIPSYKSIISKCLVVRNLSERLSIFTVC